MHQYHQFQNKAHLHDLIKQYHYHLYESNLSISHKILIQSQMRVLHLSLIHIFVARMLQKSNKPIILAVNKIDDQAFKDSIYDFYSLGIGDPIAVSGSHGIGIGDILDEIVQLLPQVEEEKEEDVIRFSIIGRPNVGKSSLTNAILGEDRVIVSDVEGTTRDAIDTAFEKDGQKYCVCLLYTSRITSSPNAKTLCFRNVLRSRCCKYDISREELFR